MRTPGPPGGQPPVQSPMTGQMAPPTGPAPAGGIRPAAPQQPPIRQPPPQVAGMNPQQVPVQQQPPSAPAPPPTAHKQNRITTMPRPLGLDPILILHERENRYI